MANVKIGPLAPSIYCVHQRIAVQIAAAVDADQPDWRNRLAAVIARHLDAAAQNRSHAIASEQAARSASPGSGALQPSRLACDD